MKEETILELTEEDLDKLTEVLRKVFPDFHYLLLVNHEESGICTSFSDLDLMASVRLAASYVHHNFSDDKEEENLDGFIKVSHSIQ